MECWRYIPSEKVISLVIRTSVQPVLFWAGMGGKRLFVLDILYSTKYILHNRGRGKERGARLNAAAISSCLPCLWQLGLGYDDI
jgi:hypothetical protein